MAFMSVGADGRILTAERRVVELIGYSPEELVGRPVLDLYAPSPAGRERARELFERFRSGETVRCAEVELRHRSGGERTLGLAVRPVLDAAGAVVRSRSLLVDLERSGEAALALGSCYLEAEASLGGAGRELAACRRRIRRQEPLVALGRLHATLAHELSGPLGEMRLAADSALELGHRASLDRRYLRAVERLVGHGRRMGRILASVRRLAAGEPGEPRPSDLAAVARRARQASRAHARCHGAEIALHLDPSLPPALVDPLELELALVNLLHNACEAGEGVSVELSVRHGDGGLRVVVDDDGEGLAPAGTDPFASLETTRRGGLGLGLALVRRLLERQGGAVHAGASRRGGSRFVLELPCAAPGEEGS